MNSKCDHIEHLTDRGDLSIIGCQVLSTGDMRTCLTLHYGNHQLSSTLVLLCHILLHMSLWEPHISFVHFAFYGFMKQKHFYVFLQSFMTTSSGKKGNSVGHTDHPRFFTDLMSSSLHFLSHF